MKVKVESRDFSKSVTLKRGTVKDLFKQLDLTPEDFIASKNGSLVLEDEKLKNRDKIKLFPVISGG